MAMVTDQTVRPLLTGDSANVRRLFASGTSQHLHVDWETLPELLQNPDLCCSIVEHAGRITAALGATLHFGHPAENQTMAWLRLAHAGNDSSDHTLDWLWQSLQSELKRRGVCRISTLGLNDWIRDRVVRWGFTQVNRVITLQKANSTLPPLPPPSFAIRPVQPSELNQIALLDSASFEIMWRYNRLTLNLASRYAARFTIIEDANGQGVGYQLSTWHVDSGHLARLAIIPSMQGQGLGGFLLGDTFRYFQKRGIRALTVNTQEDNLPSQRLYERWGFERTDHRVSVWTLDI